MPANHTSRSDRVGLEDVARDVGVSISTVSCVLRNVPYARVSKAKRREILGAAKRLGYQPDISAMTLAKGRAPLIGVVMPTLSLQHYPHIVEGVETEARNLGYQTVVMCAGRTGFPSQLEAIRVLRAYRVSGIVLCPTDTHHDEPLIEAIETIGAPVVLIDRPTRIPATAVVAADNREGGWMAGKWLLSENCDRLLFLNRQTRGVCPSIWTQRLAGLREACAANAVEVRDVFLGGAGADADAQSVEDLRWAFAAQRPGVLLMSFYTFPALLNALTACGISMPKSVRLCGFDQGQWTVHDHEVYSLLSRLETWPMSITYSAVEMGRQAVRLLLDRVEKGRWSRDSIMIPVERSHGRDTPRLVALDQSQPA